MLNKNYALKFSYLKNIQLKYDKFSNYLNFV